MNLGDVGKAMAGQFVGKRKLLLVPYVAAFSGDPELVALAGRYWSEVAAQVRALEASLGRVSHLFCEGVVDGGDADLAAVERANGTAAPFLREIAIRGAALRPTEDAEPFLEALDLQRCLMVARASAPVMRRLSEWLHEARRRRYDAIRKHINDALKSEEVCVLIVGQDHQVQFPADVQVIYVAPPALSDIERWARDHGGPESPLQDPEPAAK